MFDWKSKALERAQKVSEDVETYICPVTEMEIGFCVGDKTFTFESTGTCEECGIDFHISAMRTRDGMSKADWPVHYEGLHCKACYVKDVEVDIVLDEPIETEEEEEELEEEEETSEETNQNT